MHTVLRITLPFADPAKDVRVVAIEPDCERAVWQRLRSVTAEMGQVPTMYSRPTAGGRWVVAADDGSLEIWETRAEVVSGYVMNSTRLVDRKVAVFAVVEAVVPATVAPQPLSPTHNPLRRVTASSDKPSMPYMPELCKVVSLRKKRT